ncbi:hypothetical protein CALCODRAFT_102919 [Calocera cornea HHB12733]|uniref:Uncharacterized protein n=1 Tax=Calocera cornea HHB12733 TaxID=1353952 RepID=A0A165D5B6_9BASI|nr:hypothetical protein CALCODRAFT_102919 [Calocera cornea HHB12733]
MTELARRRHIGFILDHSSLILTLTFAVLGDHLRSRPSTDTTTSTRRTIITSSPPSPHQPPLLLLPRLLFSLHSTPPDPSQLPITRCATHSFSAVASVHLPELLSSTAPLGISPPSPASDRYLLLGTKDLSLGLCRPAAWPRCRSGQAVYRTSIIVFFALR